MAATIRQTKSGEGANETAVVTLDTNVLAGSLIVVCVTSNGVTNITGVTDNQSNDYGDPDVEIDGGPEPFQLGGVRIYSVITQSAGALTVTLTRSSTSGTGRITVFEVEGADILDQVALLPQEGGASVTTDPVTPGTDGQFLVSAVVTNVNVTFTEGSGWTLVNTQARHLVQRILQETAGSQAASASASASTNWGIVMATYGLESELFPPVDESGYVLLTRPFREFTGGF